MSPSDKIKNHLLYSYVQMAYEFVLQLGQPQIQGSQAAFLSRLYRQRLDSILDHAVGGYDAPFEMNAVQNWLVELRRQRAADFLVGAIDGLTIDPDGQTPWLASLDQYAAAFEEDNTPGRPLVELGTEAYATYLPIHFFFHQEDFLDANWGIYISEEGVARVAAALKKAFEGDRRFGKLKKEEDNLFFLQAAYQVLLRHELLHFRIESFALNAELILQKPLYVPYLMNVYSRDYATPNCLEEALANATVLDSNVLRDVFKKMYPDVGSQWQPVLAGCIFDRQPPGYQNYDFRQTDSSTWQGNHTQRSYVSTWNIVANAQSPVRQLAMNYLCNQILTGDSQPSPNLTPFFAFLPDNYFLRAEHLVPIHVVQTLRPEDSFIRLSPPKRRDWEQFLKAIGYEATNRGRGDHIVWERTAGGPHLTLNYKNSELDLNSFKSSLKALGLNWPDFDAYRQTKEVPLHKLSLPNLQAGLRI